MQNLFQKPFVLLMMVAFCSFSASAWDDVGHKLTAIIAWERMTPEAREKAFNLLNSAPEDSDLNVLYDRFNSRSEGIKKLELFMFAANWPDVVRDRSFGVRHKNYHQGDWHYADIFWKQENGKASILKDFPEESGKAIQKLYDLEKILRDASYKDEEKAIAIAWFLHIGGDLHNPVHNGSRVTEYSPKGDQGGNRFILVSGSETRQRIDLHSYWDSIIGETKPRKKDAGDIDYLVPIARKITKKFPFKKMQDRLKLGDYKAWNMEGFELLDKAVYTSDLTRNQLPSKKYNKRAYQLAREKTALAGYRLGETLNQVFKESRVSRIENEPIPEKLDAFPSCQVIRTVLYPISKLRKSDQKLRIALLDICPPNRGLVSRPMTSVMVGGTSIMREFDVERVFETAKEAQDFAKKNGINDASYN